MRKVFYFLPLLFSIAIGYGQAGLVDVSFNAAGTPPGRSVVNVNPFDDEIWGMAIQTNGNIVVAGRTNYTTPGGTGDFLVARYKYNGTLDSTFGTNGFVTTSIGPGNDYAFAVAIQPDKKILVAGVTNVSGSDNDFAVIRYDTTGHPDSTFGIYGIATLDIGKGATTGTDDHCQAMALQSDGKIMLAGFRNAIDGDFVIVRLKSDGTPDGTFGTNGIAALDISGVSEDYCDGIIIQSSGKYVLSGSTASAPTGGSPEYDFCMVRFNTDGTIDNTFGANGNGIVITPIDEDDHGYSITQQPDGKIVQAGCTSKSQFDPSDGTTQQRYDFAAVRFSANGIIDNSFGNYAPGITRLNVAGGYIDDMARSVQVQDNGKLVLGGEAGGDYALLRLNINGAPDPSFGTAGIVTLDLDQNGSADEGHVLKLTSNRIYLAGYTRQSGSNNMSIAAFISDAAGASLPLTLTSFYGQKQTGKVLLQWQTVNEQDVQQFVIERSTDGKSFKSIGQIAAAGNSTTARSYSFTDPSPFTSNNYYRLQMKDADGQYKYSKILIIKFDVLAANLQVYPSPVTDALHVQLPDGFTGKIGLQIIDMGGRVIKQATISSDGNALSTSLDVSSLLKGVYIFKAQTAASSVTTQFIKQ